MRSRRETDQKKRYPILSNKPVEINNPQRKAKMITAAWIAALVMCSIAGSYVAATVAINQNDDNKAQLRAELEKRSKERDTQADAFQHALDQYRADQCRITALLPQNPDIVDLRRRYRCTNPVTPPAPAQSPAAAPSPASFRTSLTALPRQPGPRGVTAPGPGPIPQPPPPVPPAPVPAPPVVPPLPSPGRRCIQLPPIGACLTLEL